MTQYADAKLTFSVKGGLDLTSITKTIVNGSTNYLA